MGLSIDIKCTLGKYGYSDIPDDVADLVLVATVNHVHYTAVKKAPVDRGDERHMPDDVVLRENIQKEIDLPNKAGYVFVKKSDIPYLFTAEYGTRSRLAHPFMRPAAAAGRGKMKAIIRASTKEVVDKKVK